MEFPTMLPRLKQIVLAALLPYVSAQPRKVTGSGSTSQCRLDRISRSVLPHTHVAHGHASSVMRDGVPTDCCYRVLAGLV